MIKYVIFSVVLFISPLLNAQLWIDAQSGKEVNLYRADESFEVRWKGENYVRGHGYKQYQRWKNFWEPRLFPTGEFTMVSNDYFRNYSSNSGGGNMKLTNFGNWESLGINTWSTTSYSPGNGRVNCVFQSASDTNVIYVGSASGGLWKSINQGNSWTPLSDNLPSLGISGIVEDPNNSNVLYIATGDSEHLDVYGAGVFKSLDGGNSWNTTGLSWAITEQRTTVKLLMHPSNSQILFCATSHGLMKTTNGGFSWDTVLNGHIRDVEFKPNDPSVVYCTKKRMYKSIDGGDSFDAVSDPAFPVITFLSLSKIAVTPANPEVVYLFSADENYGFQGLYKSIDSGENWTLQADSPNVLSGSSSGTSPGGQAWYDMAIAVSPDDEDLIVVGGVNLWKSSNGGVNWILNSYWYYEDNMPVNFVHADIHHLEFVGDKLYCGSDGGIFLSVDNSNTYQDISSGLVISQFTKLGVNKQNSNTIIAGAQDNGSNIFSQNIWRHSFGGDGGECAFLPSDSMVVFCSTQNGGIRKSTDGGQVFSPSVAGISEDGAWVTPYVISPLNDNFMYAAFQNVWRSTSQGESWAKISDINQTLHSIAIGMNDPNTIYTASYDNLYRTNNGGGAWSNVSSGLPNQAITGIVVDPLNVDHIWVTFSGFSQANKVYYSENGGTNWENISDNLPNIPINCIAFDDQGANGVYVGTDTGVFYTNDNLAHWEPFMNNLPKTIVTELEVHGDDQLIFASTFGRGLWKSALFDISQIPESDFSFSPLVICEGMNIDFVDLSSLASPGWEWSFEGANTTVSLDENPSVSYGDAGVYDVSLTVENSLGQHTYICENCIHVIEENSLTMPYQQNFESSNDLTNMYWFPLDENGWKLSENVGASGNHSIWIDNFPLNSHDFYEIISRPIYLNAPQAYLSFKYSYAQIVESNNDNLRLYLSDDCGQSWQLVNTWFGGASLVASEISENPYFPQNPQDWQQVNIEVNELFTEKDVLLKFKFQNKNGNNIFIDDINISQDPIAVFNEKEKPEIYTYPNPTNDILHFVGLKNGNYHLVFYNFVGDVVKQSSVNSNVNAVVDISTLDLGVYFYQIYTSHQQVLATGRFTVLK